MLLNRNLIHRFSIEARAEDLESYVLDILGFVVSGYRSPRSRTMEWLVRNIDHVDVLNLLCEMEDFIASILDRTLFNWRNINATRFDIQYIGMTSVQIFVLPGVLPMHYPVIPQTFRCEMAANKPAIFSLNVLLDYDAIVTALGAETIQSIDNMRMSLCTLLDDCMRICQLCHLNEIDHDFIANQYNAKRLMTVLNTHMSTDTDDPFYDKIFLTLEAIYVDAIDMLSRAMYQTFRDVYPWVLRTMLARAGTVRQTEFAIYGYQIHYSTIYIEVGVRGTFDEKVVF